MIRGVKKEFRATVTPNQGQANLDFSEKTITNQHSPINNGQGLPSAYADMPTNANGTQADLNFDPNTISNSTNYPMNMNSTGTNSTNPFPENLTLKNPPEFQVTPEKIIDNRDLAQENTPPSVNVNPPTPSMIGGNRLTQEEYQAILKQQKQNKTKNFKPTAFTTPKKLEFNSQDFFKGTKSGFTETKITNQFEAFGKDVTIKTTSYKDVNPFGDFVDLPQHSNAKKNQKALKDQFDLYSNISNF